jgi:lipopolysaccharide export system permease protein
VNQQSTELRDRYQQRSDLARVTPGVFQNSSDGRRVFFVERESPDGINARNVFVLTQLRNVESVTTARSGRLESQGNDRVLVLESGQRNDSDGTNGERTLSSFETYRVLADDQRVRKVETLPPRAMRTVDLVRQPDARNQGELAWRLGLLIAAANLLLLGIALSAVNPRRASNWNLVFALLTFVVYLNLVNLTQNWVASGRIGMGTAMLTLHGGGFGLALALLWWRDHGTSVRVGRRSAPVRVRAVTA